MRAGTLEHGEVVTYAFDMLRADEQPAEDAQLVMGRPRYQARAAELERDAIVSLL